MKDFEKDFLLAEYNMLRADLKAVNEFLRRDTQLLFVVLGGLGGVVLYQGDLSRLPLLALFVPSVLFVYICMQIVNLSVTSAEVHACARIECKVNERLEWKAMEWESRLAPEEVRKLSAPPFVAVVAVLIFLVFLFLLASYYSHENFGCMITSLHVAEFLTMCFLFVSLGIQELTRPRPSA